MNLDDARAPYHTIAAVMVPENQVRLLMLAVDA